MMPVFVEEVVISVEVVPANVGATADAADSGQLTQTHIAECVERVLEILAQREEA